jgi:hypothetical protein|nr:MAG TPA: hypothetical protein [Caudoviricetes sp.]DAX98493.1 MAG TPA: hypothetical protein [Caudoviricetes sp.]
MKMFLNYIVNLILKTFYKKKYYERSPSKAIVPYMNKNKIQVHEDKFEELLATKKLTIEKISAKNLKVERLEDIKEWNL